MTQGARRGVSVLALSIFAAVPALALGGVWQYAESSVPPPTTTTTTTLPPPPADELTTRLLSYRRHPEPLAAEAAEATRQAELAALADELTELLGPGACLDVVAADGTTIASLAPRSPVVPASNQKLLVAAVALAVLGPDHRFRTELLASAPPVDGVIAGDVYLVGGGDPLLTTAALPDPNRYPAFNTTSVDALADAVQSAGVVRIDGELVGDGSRYTEDPGFRAPTWAPDIGPPTGGPVDALLINDGLIDANGNFGFEPSRSAARVFADLLIARGITVAGGAAHRERPRDVELTSLGAVESAPLTEVLVELLHTSDNNTAEMLLMEIGHATGNPSRQGGLEAVWNQLAAWGVPLDGVDLADGSGLSRADTVSCATLTGLLTGAPVATDLIRLLPVAGRDGTLAAEFAGSPAEGALRAKTGTLTGVKALAGVTPDGAGRDVVFAVVLNGEGVDDPAVYRPVWDRLVGTVAGYPVVATPDVTPFEPLP